MRSSPVIPPSVLAADRQFVRYLNAKSITKGDKKISRSDDIRQRNRGLKSLVYDFNRNEIVLDGDADTVVAVTMELRALIATWTASHPSASSRLRTATDCCVCYTETDPADDFVVLERCGHVMHMTCFAGLIESACNAGIDIKCVPSLFFCLPLLTDSHLTKIADLLLFSELWPSDCLEGLSYPYSTIHSHS